MHIAASLMTVLADGLARPCVRSAPLKCACTVVVPSPGGGGGGRHLATVPEGVVGDCLPWAGGQGGRGDLWRCSNDTTLPSIVPLVTPPPTIAILLAWGGGGGVTWTKKHRKY